MEALSSRVGFYFHRRDIKLSLELVDFLIELELRAREDGLRPIVVLDMHGDPNAGLSLCGPGESLPWAELGKLLAAINVSTANNLCVIGGACYSLRTIAPAKLDQPAPFFVLLAPEHEVSVGFLEDNFPAFFDHLFTQGEIDGAYSRYLSEHFRYFHCEKMLFIVVGRYVREACKGRSAAERRERLLTEVFEQGLPNTPENRQAIRAKIKAGLRPDQALLDRYARGFLIGRSCSFNMEQLLSFLDKG
ncbi:hypothetical protein [Burkholderia pseudomallei]